MNRMLHDDRNRPRNGWLLRHIVSLAMWVVLSAAVFAQSPKPFRLDTSGAPGHAPCIAAVGNNLLAVGWIVPDGSESGIYLRRRVNLLWDAPIRIGGDIGVQPRDLDMAFDPQGRLHLVWTAFESDAADGPRGLYVARLEPGSSKLVGQRLALDDLAPEAEEADAPSVTIADFPVLCADAADGVVVVWQESRGLRFAIRAARLLDDGGVGDMGRISGVKQNAVAPQILASDPLCVAWYEIDESRCVARVDQWRPDERRWRPSAFERLLSGLPTHEQVLLHPNGSSLAACWQSTDSDALNLAFWPNLLTDTGNSRSLMLTETADDVAGLDVSGRPTDRLTFVRQVFTPQAQSIQLGGIAPATSAPQRLTISESAQRFAAMPDHVTVGNWSAVVWIDDARDGGDGHVYFATHTWTGTTP